MIASNIYLIQVALTWGLLYGFYLLFLGNETFFKTNRFYLLGALVVGLILPFIQTIMQQAEVGMQVIQLPTVTITNQELVLPESEKNVSEFSVSYWLLVVYWIGFGVMALRFMRDVVGVVWLIRSNRKEKVDGLTIIQIERDMAPFSFFNYLFVFDRDHFSQEEWRQVLLHEKTHIDQLHSLDILFTEVLKIIFWWNPLVYLYQRALREVHEYEADYAVKKEENIKQYGLLLMKQSLSGNQVAVANSFINSQLKKRIVMMTKKRSNSLAKLKYAWSLPLLLLLFFVSFGNHVLAQSEVPKVAFESMDTLFTVDPNTYEETMDVVKSVWYENHDLDKIAILRGCETKGDLEAQKKCSNNKLLTKLYANVKYPQEARLTGMEGTAVIKILIIDDGSSIFEVLKDPGFGMGAEVVRALQAADLDWRPAEIAGKKVNVEFILPVKFMLEGGDSQSIVDDKNTPFHNIETNYASGDLRVDFKYEDGDDEHIKMTVYDLTGRFMTTDDGTSDFFEKHHLNTKSSFLIVVLEDTHGNKVVRKVARTD